MAVQTSSGTQHAAKQYGGGNSCIVVQRLCRSATCVTVQAYWALNLQTNKLFIVTLATKRGSGYDPLRFSVSIKIWYRVVQLLIQHCLLSKMVELIIKYAIATRN